jgi:antitoxin (DNA-binding transcriptional repressor) of toxin-antitoxin stability system
MKTIAAGKFKDVCLQTLDEVAANRTTVVITKRGKPVARLVPITAAAGRPRSLAGSIISESGDPYSTGDIWDADRS